MREEANGALSEETVSICGAYSLVCQHEAARGKAFLFAKSMHWISGPSPSPQVTQRDGALDKKALIPCRACACADLGQCAQDHYDSGVLAELLMRETIKKWAKANFPLFCNTYSLSCDWRKA